MTNRPCFTPPHGGFWTPKTSFSGHGDSGPLFGRGLSLGGRGDRKKTHSRKYQKIPGRYRDNPRTVPNSGCRKRRSAKGVRSLFFVFRTLSVTFWSLFLMLLSLLSSLFCQTPFAGLLLRQGDQHAIPSKSCSCVLLFMSEEGKNHPKNPPQRKKNHPSKEASELGDAREQFKSRYV